MSVKEVGELLRKNNIPESVINSFEGMLFYVTYI